uniref:Uncharacterized protein n=1 Tax=Candidatus Berkiella cookevillensis TaxID=437022 RepID=A0A0Q9YKH2_9GAMM
MERNDRHYSPFKLKQSELIIFTALRLFKDEYLYSHKNILGIKNDQIPELKNYFNKIINHVFLRSELGLHKKI